MEISRRNFLKYAGFFLGASVLGCSKIADDTLKLRDPVIRERRIITRKEWGADKPDYDNMSEYPKDIPLEDICDGIVIHHTTQDTEIKDLVTEGYGFPKAIEKHHRENKKWADIGYNFLIDKKGVIYEGRFLYYLGAHVGFNSDLKKNGKLTPEEMKLDPDYGKIGIALAGDLNNEKPTPEQIDSLIHLMIALSTKFNKLQDNIYSHSNITKMMRKKGIKVSKPKIYCPGYNFPLDAVKQRFNEERIYKKIALMEIPDLRLVYY